MQTLPDWLVCRLRPIPFRGKLRLLDPLLPRKGHRSAMVFKYTMDLDLNDGIQRHIYLGAYEPKETAFVRDWLKPGMTFVDVGANVGYFTALAASCVGPSGRVFAFEPQPAVYERLASMILRNALSQVQSICAGLSAAPGEMPLYIPTDSGATKNATMVAHNGVSQIRVPVKTVDQCIEDWGIEKIDLLKIDVEGHEPSVFEGAASALAAGRVRALLCEFNDPWLRLAGSSARQLHAFLLEAGFTDIEGDPTFSDSLENRFLYRLS